MKRLGIKEPKLSESEIKLNLDERLDFLSIGRWIIQRTKGHKATSDDQLLAWALYQSHSHQAPKYVLELGVGKGTISLILSALWPNTTFVGIEAFKESYELSLKNKALNQLDKRFCPILGDLRDPKSILQARSILHQELSSKQTPSHQDLSFIDHQSSSRYELICGAPPFMPIGSGVMPKDQQRASGRFELKGGIEDYLKATVQLLAPTSSSRAFMLMDGQNHVRTIKAIDQIENLKLVGHCMIRPRPNAPATYEIFELAYTVGSQPSSKQQKTADQPVKNHQNQALNQGSTLPAELCQRESTGEQWSQAYQALRERLGLQPPKSPWLFVPARLHSTRLKHKALAQIHGQSMIYRVLDRLSTLETQNPIVLASDAQVILDQAEGIKNHKLYKQLITQECHSGSQRVLRAYEQLRALIDSDWIINVQGDEPFLPIESLEALIEALPHFARIGIHIATLASPLSVHKSEQESQLKSHSLVKVCLASLESRLAVKKQHPQSLSWQKALYFTRQATGTHQHIGVYAFHRKAMYLLDLKRTALAKAEDLEQLTWLEHGHEIGVVCLKNGHLPGIDTAEDLERARQLFQEL